MMDKKTAVKNIKEYIGKCGYTWGVWDLVADYKNYYLQDKYVSHTAEDCFTNLKDEFKCLAQK